MPVPSCVPPDAAENHSYVPPGAVAVSVALLPAQMEVPAAVGAAGVGAAVTSAVCVMAAQPVVLSDTVTEYVPIVLAVMELADEPELQLYTYGGLPPVTDAVKGVLAPEQMAGLLGVMDTAMAGVVYTRIVSALAAPQEVLEPYTR